MISCGSYLPYFDGGSSCRAAAGSDSIAVLIGFLLLHCCPQKLCLVRGHPEDYLEGFSSCSCVKLPSILANRATCDVSDISKMIPLFFMGAEPVVLSCKLPSYLVPSAGFKRHSRVVTTN